MNRVPVVFVLLALCVAGAAFWMLRGDEDADTSARESPTAVADTDTRRPGEAPDVKAPADGGVTATSPLVERTEAPAMLADPAPADAKADPASTTERLVVRGRVVSETGSGLGGVPVEVSNAGRFRADGENADGKTVSAADGSFSIATTVTEFGHRVRANPAQLVTASAKVPGTARGEFNVGDLVARAGGSISGIVRDDAGLPVAGAKVAVMRRDQDSGNSGFILFGGFGDAERTVNTDASGRYHVDGIGAGKVAVLATRDGFASGSQEDVDIRVGITAADTNIELARGGQISGVVVDERGQLLAGASVRVEDTIIQLDRPGISGSLGADRTVTTDARGGFQLAGLTATSYHVRASLDGFLPNALADVAVGTNDVRITLSRSGILYGYVTNATTDAALEDFELSVVRSGGYDFDFAASRSPARVLRGAAAAELVGVAVTDGLFVVTSLPGDHVDVALSAAGFADYRHGPIEVAAGAKARLDVELVPELRLRGIVLDPDDQPVRGAEVTVSRAQEAGVTGGFARRVEVRGGPGGQPRIFNGSDSRSATTDETGRFEVTGLTAGRFSVNASHREWAPMDARPIDLADGEVPEELELHLMPGGALTGVTYDADGQLLANATVSLKPAPKPGADNAAEFMMLGSHGLHGPTSTTSDGEGRYEMRGLAAGQYYAEVKAPQNEGGGLMMFSFAGLEAKPKGVPITIEAGETAQLDLALSPTGRVEGLVLAAGEPVQAAGIRLLESGDSSGFPNFGGPSATSDDQGRFHFDNVEPGDYTLSISVAGAARPIDRELQVQARETARPTIKLPTGSIRGVVEDIDSGDPIADVTVSVSPAGSKSAPEGAGRPRATRAVAIAMVADSGGGPATRYTLGTSDNTTVITDAEGRYELKYLDAGAYDVEIQGAGITKTTEEGVRVNEGAVTDNINFKATRGATIVVSVSSSGPELPFFVVEMYNLATPENVERQATGGTDSVTFQGLAPGRYHISASSNNLKGSDEIDLASAEERQVTIPLR